MFICKYCGKECKNKNSLTQHEIRCKYNPNKLDMSYIKPGHSKGHKGTNQFIKAKQLGINKPVVSDITRLKISEKTKGKVISEESKHKISEAMKRLAKENPDVYCGQHTNGRVKKYLYNNVYLDGTWEVIIAKYLDKHNIKWIRPKKPFEYMQKNSLHYYYPDFYIPEFDYYIEVKGYETERDLIKYKTINNLIVIKKHEVNCILNDTYNILNFIQ